MQVMRRPRKTPTSRVEKAPQMPDEHNQHTSDLKEVPMTTPVTVPLTVPSTMTKIYLLELTVRLMKHMFTMSATNSLTCGNFC